MKILTYIRWRIVVKSFVIVYYNYYYHYYITYIYKCAYLHLFLMCITIKTSERANSQQSIKQPVLCNWKVSPQQWSQRSTVSLKYTCYRTVYWQSGCRLQLYHLMLWLFLHNRLKGQKRLAISANILLLQWSRNFSALLDDVEMCLCLPLSFFVGE